MKRFYDTLTILSMITTPAAAAIFFGWRMYAAALDVTQSAFWAIVAGGATAIALESIGMLTGHVGSDFWRKGDPRWRVATLIMLLYVIVGMAELWKTAGMLIFVLSPAVYILSALRHTATIEAQQEQIQATNDEAWKREQERQEADHRRQMQLRQQELKHQERLAKLQNAQKLRLDNAQINGSDRSDWRLLSDADKQQIAALSSGEIAEMFGISGATARRWRAKVSANGHGTNHG